MKFSTDMVIAIGLVIALLVSIVLGTGGDLSSTIAAGLVGYLGRNVQAKAENLLKGGDVK